MTISHLLWKDHSDVREVAHTDAAADAAEVLQFFTQNWQCAEEVRLQRHVVAPAELLQTILWEEFDSSLLSDGKAYRFLLPFDTEMYWYPHWLSTDEADTLERTVRDRVTFLHPTYQFQNPEGGFTKTLIKRGQLRICGSDCIGAVAAQPLENWSETLLRKVEDSSGCPFNCFVANHYANGRVVINWHSDHGPGDDEGLGPNPHIGSLSLGASRVFSLKSKRKLNGRMIHMDIPLRHGSLLVMGKNSQTHWLHALPADESCSSERINLTFRFYARQSTKHIEGMEHNHEWEAAPDSVRVLLHREPFGKPVLVDIPRDMVSRQLPKYLSTVLPGMRGAADVYVRDLSEDWKMVPPDSVVAKDLPVASSGVRPEIRVKSGGRYKQSVAERQSESQGYGQSMAPKRCQYGATSVPNASARRGGGRWRAR